MPNRIGTTGGRQASAPGHLLGPTRLGLLSGGALGMLGFSLAVFCGLAADNAVGDILERAVLTSIVLAAVGGLAGSIAGRVFHEHFVRRLAARAEAEASQAAARQVGGPAAGTGGWGEGEGLPASAEADASERPAADGEEAEETA